MTLRSRITRVLAVFMALFAPQLFAHPAIRDRLLAARHWIDRAFGAAMVALGLRVLATARD